MIRALEEKPSAKLMSQLGDEAMLQARLDSSATNGPAYIRAFVRRYSVAVNQLPWNVVQEEVKTAKGSVEVETAAFITGAITAEVQPMVDKSGSIDNEAAWWLVSTRSSILYFVPLRNERATVLKSYIAAHSVIKPDI
jgi:hypothetical protein